jgi:acyl-CoA synthetase (AMP-forming)/AMP-acid ligase II
MSVLYEAWLETVCHHGVETALTDAVTGVSWSFADLHTLALGTELPGEIALPCGRGVDFFLTILAAWRQGLPMCPLDGPAPSIMPSVHEMIQRGVEHLKITSGSTGTPKLVLLTGAQLIADCRQICATMGISRSQQNVAAISLAHSYGFSNLVLPLLLHGVPLVLAGDALPQSVSRALSQTQNAVLPAVPAMWKAWFHAGILTNTRISLAISAGAPLELELEQKIFEACGLKIHNFYGSSECGGIAYDATDTPRRDALLAGHAMSEAVISIGNSGLLEVRGSAVALGYWPAAEADADILSGGRFVTSDLADYAEQGSIRLIGRSGDMINIAGRKLHPAEVENALLNCDGVKCAVVVGVPSREASRCEEVAAVVAPLPGFDLPTVRLQLAKALEAWKCPRHWLVSETLAPDSRGKISRSIWKSQVLASAIDKHAFKSPK